MKIAVNIPETDLTVGHRPLPFPSPVHDRVVCELIGRAVVLCHDDIRHGRESYAVTLAAREVVSATKEDKDEALEALRRLRR